MTQTFSKRRYTDERGHEHGFCAFCNADCSTHPDAANPLDPCGDCGAVTCPDHRVCDEASRCVECATVFYRTEVPTTYAIFVNDPRGGFKLFADYLPAGATRPPVLTYESPEAAAAALRDFGFINSTSVDRDASGNRIPRGQRTAYVVETERRFL